ncbi:MAG: DNRLRE domain-containing protein [Wenzhouxiangellaceae bacterium]|nr:DNRLRE domain-containing protein [Wenzhouxiangellaceae bacterium]
MSSFLSTRGRRIGLLLLAVSIAGASSAGDVLVAGPDRDNTLYERVAGDVSNGAGSWLFVGRTGVNAGERLRRALLRFDVSAIPPGATITSVELVVEVDRVPPGATAFIGGLHRMLADWGEAGSDAPGPEGGGAPAEPGDATWLHRFHDTVFWSTAGGDFEAVPSGTADFGPGTGTTTFASTAGLVSDVQGWVDAPATNHGWILVGEESNPLNARRIGSRENAVIPPVLQVGFEPPPPLPETRSVPVLTPVPTVLFLALVLVVGLVAVRGRGAG